MSSAWTTMNSNLRLDDGKRWWSKAFESFQGMKNCFLPLSVAVASILALNINSRLFQLENNHWSLLKTFFKFFYNNAISNLKPTNHSLKWFKLVSVTRITFFLDSNDSLSQIEWLCWTWVPFVETPPIPPPPILKAPTARRYSFRSTITAMPPAILYWKVQKESYTAGHICILKLSQIR